MTCILARHLCVRSCSRRERARRRRHIGSASARANNAVKAGDRESHPVLKNEEKSRECNSLLQGISEGIFRFCVSNFASLAQNPPISARKQGIAQGITGIYNLTSFAAADYRRSNAPFSRRNTELAGNADVDSELTPARTASASRPDSASHCQMSLHRLLHHDKRAL